jgi:DNA-binding CsgD family transcriptional regulator
MFSVGANPVFGAAPQADTARVEESGRGAIMLGAVAIESSPTVHQLTENVAATISTAYLSGASEPRAWLRATAEAIAQPFGSSANGPHLVAHAAVAGMSAAGQWRILHCAASNEPAAEASGDVPPIESESIVRVPLEAFTSCEVASRSRWLNDDRWEGHPLRAERQVIGYGEFVGFSMDVDAGNTRRRLYLQVDQPLGQTWPEAEIMTFLRAVGPHLARAYVAQVLRPELARESLLGRVSPIQRQVLGLLVEGKTEAMISKAMRRSPYTIHDHIRAIYAALRVSSRFELLSKWHAAAGGPPSSSP